ncbi:MAG TPA: DUF4034 domain-containing protein [Pirellulales bacterium]
MRFALVLFVCLAPRLAVANDPAGDVLPARPAGQIADGADRDRAVAQWALERGGQIRPLVSGKVLAPVKSVDDLPGEPFTIHELELRGMVLEPRELAEVAALKTLARLIITDAVIGRRGIEDLAAGCGKLKCLVFRHSCIDDEGLRPIARLKALDILSLEYCAVTDAALDVVAQLPKLRSLNLAATLVTDATLGKIATFRQLEILDLHATRVSPAAIGQLAALKSLRNIALQDTATNDAAAQQLATLTSLKNLALERTKVSQSAVDALRKSLPGCKIAWKPGERPAAPPPPGRPPPAAVAPNARVNVSGTRGFVSVAVESYCNPQLMACLKGATVFAPKPLPAGPHNSQGRIGVEIAQDTGLLLAVRFEQLPKSKVDWVRECLRAEAMRMLGWIGVGEVTFKDPALGFHYVYWRACKKGELLRLRTSRTAPPLVIVPAADSANPVIDGPDPSLSPEMAAWVMRNKSQYLLQTRSYDDLEATIAKIRREKQHFRSGHSYLSMFYDGLTSYPSTEQGFQAQQAELEAWLKAKPKSVAAHLALIHHWVFYAWQARGSGWASSVTPDGWEKFGQRLAVAQDLIQRAWQLDERDAYLCRDEVLMIKATAADHDRVEALVAKSIDINPTYRGTIFQAGAYYLPRWHGKPGDLEKFALRALELTRKEWGAAVYAQMVWDAKSAHGYAVFDDFDFSWDLVKEGYHELGKHFPESSEPMGHLSALAHIKGDRQAAREARSHLGRGDLRGFGTSESLELFYRWLADDYAQGDQAALYEGNHARVLQLLEADHGNAWITFDTTPEFRLWNAHSGERSRRGRIDGLVRNAWLEPGGAYAVSTTATGEIYRCHFASGASQRLAQHESLRAAVLSPNGTSIVTSGNDHEIRFWDVATGNLATVWDIRPAVATSIDFLPDGKSLIAGTRDKTAIIWSTADQAKLGELAPFPAGVDIVRVSPDAALAACLAGKELSLWDLEKRVRLGVLENPAGQINDLVFSSDGKTLAAPTGTRWPVANGDVLVWDVAGRKLVHQFHGHKAAVNAVRFAPDGKTLASCSDDGSIRVWKLAEDKGSTEK